MYVSSYYNYILIVKKKRNYSNGQKGKIGECRGLNRKRDASDR